MSKAFIWTVVIVLVLGLGVLGYTYFTPQTAVAPSTAENIAQPVATTTSSVDTDLKGVQTDLNNLDANVADFSTQDIVDLEKDLESSQFDVL
ncbi:MAG: hypothetical protein COX39_00975 [Candidatus Nealsonbacteria bacterium CG23_combo_of_CG06-09_8_20_14_all_40_13]|uniref:Uncharacterized protein n=1 Tax=Candidatus Nealsonbacteria bacterium CG23_combo_of_CG06-09_8_20_14_all_40_13 TaxID=1974724 RepID=A0A2G9YRJ5_9BACT|nr:MAG: hypothetical protein COX39_00975 [Candidatus Nealsonbacteria bacterium CG23_combo_of_CG06-09_8_20_14_all_40_13]PIR70852.1 MAG: hypothetical protein COU44_02810 [Candidatus Nealsonbacteria bacterium CG10_big_fil_rev_8_21_14_0_10_40_24]PIU43417.1 MAG: hypothetical protein COS97_01170 [Candidatus Nealsonbacteria bacterium CG07_land_8_20_14_0_80_40_10]